MLKISINCAYEINWRKKSTSARPPAAGNDFAKRFLARRYYCEYFSDFSRNTIVLWRSVESDYARRGGAASNTRLIGELEKSADIVETGRQGRTTG